MESQNNISLGDRERLIGYLDGVGKTILPEPQAALTKASKMPGLDGQKMSKSYGNTIALREPLDQVEKKIRTMPTDPARIRRTDAGNPEKCPVWELHKVYTEASTHEWVQQGCRSAGIGCIECKGPVIDAVKAELTVIQGRAAEYENNRPLIQSILREGAESARRVARQTMDDVLDAIHFTHRA